MDKKPAAIVYNNIVSTVVLIKTLMLLIVKF